MTMVSRNTPRAWTQPWSQGCLASEAAAGMVMVPWPASLDMRPRLTPWARATPKAPPKTAAGWKAWVKTAEKNQGIRTKLTTMSTRTVST